ncbi:DUF4129 domain-containing protein [Nocardioides sp. BGMRC 2183]|nr:DUF4129 domain-containing protein [Nocardioides sp. BGMRC 2183]
MAVDQAHLPDQRDPDAGGRWRRPSAGPQLADHRPALLAHAGDRPADHADHRGRRQHPDHPDQRGRPGRHLPRPGVHLRDPRGHPGAGQRRPERLRHSVRERGERVAVPGSAHPQGGVRRRADATGRAVAAMSALVDGPVLSALVAAEPPLDPSGEEARRRLTEELADPRYVDRGIVERVLDWIGRAIDDSIGAAEGWPALTVLAAILVVLLLALALAWLVTRARSSRADRMPSARPALTDEAVDAATLRVRAEAALAAGDARTGVVDGFRALALRQIERGAIDGGPQSTAHELGRAIAAVHPGRASALVAAADAFDEVLYGDHPATAEVAREVLALDDALAGAHR